MDAKLPITKYRKWKAGLWRNHLSAIETNWRAVLEEWIEPDWIPDFDETVEVVARRMRELGLD